MTAILQPGDRIHLAIPTSQRQIAGPVSQSEIDRTNTELQAEAHKSAAELTRLYKALGVEVVIWSSTTMTTGPTVVAIFRGPAPQPDGCLCDQIDVTRDPARPEFLRGKESPYCPIHGKEKQ